ncbi:MAG TPA: type I 3-dehydroquinate dehydratase [Thermoanaerobaculia bacterium]|nr:type I 3-dehydroquinate dehydratase [Thermoanaerobaculia bacterium]
MELFATIYEPTVERAIDAIRLLPDFIAGAELRVDRLEKNLSCTDRVAVRSATRKPLLFTRRSVDPLAEPIDYGAIAVAVDAGFDFVDVEYRPDLDLPRIDRFRDRVVLSHHDFESVPDLEQLLSAMTLFRCARMKIAVTPHSFDENRRILQRMKKAPRNLTLFGMGAQGLYSRILAPFFGSQMTFLATSGGSVAAPGQLTVEQAERIFGVDAATEAPDAIFAIVGNPVSHSRSPMIHNPIFRRQRINAVYSILEIPSFGEVFEPFRNGEPLAPLGLSVTAPYKEEAFSTAEACGALIGVNAMLCRSVNTLTRATTPEGRSTIFADNTDVDGFTTLLARADRLGRRKAMVIGAGGTARAALIALRRAGLEAVIFSRGGARAEALGREMNVPVQPLSELANATASVIINTTPADSGIDLPSSLRFPDTTLIEAAYGGEESEIAREARAAGMQIFDGMDLLLAQAARQSELFIQSLINTEVRGLQ